MADSEEHGGQQRWESFNLRASLDDLGNEFTPLLEKKEQGFVTSVEESIPACLIGDFRILRQILENLVSNGIAATPEQGAILLFVEDAGSSEKELVLRFSVIDSGFGMDDEKRNLMLNAFESASPASEPGDTGLAATAWLIRQLEGGSNLAIQSRLDCGTAISFSASFSR